MALKRITAVALLGALVAAGCGSGKSTTAASRPARNPPAFAWLHPAPPPAGWSTSRLLGTAVLAYPSSWQRVHSDPGTASAAVVQRTGLVTEYLNATPQQGAETLKDWARFRPDHNIDEGDRHEQVLASAQGLRFRNGTGSCVIDRYRTPRTSYQEIACLVRGSHETSVIVAAALAARWVQDAPALEQSVSAFLA
jgi:hypothetical protein